MKKKSKRKVMKKSTKSTKRAKTGGKGVSRRPIRPRSEPGTAILTPKQIVAAAVRFYEKDHTQHDIASKHKISPSYLARLLMTSRKAGVFVVRVVEGGKRVDRGPGRVAKSAKRRARRPAKRTK